MMALKRNGHRPKYKLICLMAVLAVVVLVLWQKDLISNALFDTSQAVQINPEEIEESTMIIGTHLIYLHALNEPLYEIAKQSASASGQDRIYYKSEMASGLWYDITDAGSLKDITTDGVVVSNEDIHNLYLTHHTKSDGITYDLRTNQSVCIYDIYPLFDLENMPELESLKMQYDLMKESDSQSDTSKRNLELTRNFFATEVEVNMVTTYSEQIKALQSYYEELAGNDASITETEAVLDVMEKVDYARKAAVFAIVDSALEELEDAAADTRSPTKDSEDEKDTIYDIDDALLTAIGNAQSEISQSLTQALGNMLEQGNSVLSSTEYRLAQSLIDAAQVHNFASCDEANARLIDLKHITEGKIVQRNTELTLLEEMIAEADQKYQQILAKGESAEYQAKTGENASHAALENLLKQDLTEVNAVRGELQFLIQSKTDRQENEAAQSFILIRIQESSVFSRQIPKDAYQSAMSTTVDQYRDWLQELLAKVKKEDTTQTQAESLYEEKAALQEQQMEALDQLDLDTAKKIEAQIQAVDNKIDEMEKSAGNKLMALNEEKNSLEKQIEQDPENEELRQQLDQLNVQIADASTDMSDGSQSANIINMKKEAMGYIQAGDTSKAAMQAVEDCITGLGSMVENGSALALDSIKELYSQMVTDSYLSDVSQYDDLISQIEQTVEQADVSGLLAAQTDPAAQKGLTADAVVSTLEEELGIELDASNSDTDEETLLLTLAECYEETGSSEIKDLLDGQTLKALEQGQDFIFESLQNNQQSFAPTEAVAKYTGYRYLWNDTKKTAVLSRGAKFYIFKSFYDTVERENSQEETMDSQAVFYGQLYIPASYISQQFGCQVIDISGTDYSVLVNDKVVEKSQELSSKLLEKGGN